MKIELKKDSWHFKFYSSMVDSPAPKSLCPYFWTLVAFFIFSPFILIYKLFKLMFKRKKVDTSKMSIDELRAYYDALDKKNKRVDKIATIVVGGIFIIMTLCIIVLFVYSVFKKGFIILLPVLIVGAVSFGTLGILVLIEKINKRYKLLYKLANLSLFVMIRGMVKAIYTKTCPLINWK